MMPYLTGEYFNPSSMYEAARGPADAIDRARRLIAKLLGTTRGSEILFTSCASESNNTAIFGAIAANPARRHIITTAVEHPAVYEVGKDLARRGFEVDFIPVDTQGRLDKTEFIRALRPETLLVSVMHANNETGVIFPIEEISRNVKERGIVFHTDAVQAAGKIPIDVGRTGVDLLSLSGHKIHAPKGIGVLYVRKGTKFSPFMIGGHQEKGRRGGTENTASIVGLGKAAELARERLARGDYRCVSELRDKLENSLLADVPHTLLNGDRQKRLPNTTSIAFEYVEGEAILLMLNEYGICASSGSACTSGSLEPSHVLRAMGVPFTAAHGSIRFSLSGYTTEEEIDFVLEKVPPIIDRLRQMSPFWQQAQKGAQSA
jgi:cysteine desulfurase